MSDVKLAGASIAVLATPVTVLQTATPLPANALKGRRSLYVFNNAAAGGAVIFVGSSAVTAASGTPVPPQSGVSINIAGNALLYGIVSSGTVDARCLELA